MFIGLSHQDSDEIEPAAAFQAAVSEHPVNGMTRYELEQAVKTEVRHAA